MKLDEILKPKLAIGNTLFAYEYMLTPEVVNHNKRIEVRILHDYKDGDVRLERADTGEIVDRFSSDFLFDNSAEPSSTAPHSKPTNVPTAFAVKATYESGSSSQYQDVTLPFTTLADLKSAIVKNKKLPEIVEVLLDYINPSRSVNKQLKHVSCYVDSFQNDVLKLELIYQVYYLDTSGASEKNSGLGHRLKLTIIESS